MSLGINPASASAAQQAATYAAAQNSAPAAGTDDASGVDPRRYTQFDRTAIEAGTAHLSFGDFMDMINPLEHIPVVSSIYRAVTGEQINPVARVAGDILYGGLMGAASAVFSGVSAVADAGLEEQTGKDSGGLAIAALFGPEDDKNKTVQLADGGDAAASAATSATLASASPAAPAAFPTVAVTQNPVSQNIEIAQVASTPPMTAALAMPANSQDADARPPGLPTPDMLMAQASAAATPNAASVPVPSAAATPMALAAATTKAPGTAAADAAPLGGISLANAKTTNKQPYGGVMGPTFSNTNAPDMTVPLSQGSPAMRMGHTIYTNRLANGARSIPPALSSSAAGKNSIPAPAIPPVFMPVSSSNAGMSAAQTAAGLSLSNMQNGPMPSGVVQNMMLKAIGQYKNTASNGANNSSYLNLTN